MRHPHVSYLWLQHKLKDGILKIAKVSGKVILGDIFTKHATAIAMADRVESVTLLKFTKPFKKCSCRVISLQKFVDNMYSCLLHLMSTVPNLFGMSLSFILRMMSEVSKPIPKRSAKNLKLTQAE